jgi:hypothetical protein
VSQYYYYDISVFCVSLQVDGIIIVNILCKDIKQIPSKNKHKVDNTVFPVCLCNVQSYALCISEQCGYLIGDLFVIIDNMSIISTHCFPRINY